ncbi:cytochrome ubiquinol oxidase subunit I, partial [Photobacterium sanctipauli]
TLEHQPAKIAAMEGHFETQKGAPLILFGLPNEETKEVDYKIAIPHLGSVILKHEWNGEVLGLDAFPEEDHPPVGIVFWSFRIMVGLGFLMLAIGLYSLWLRKKDDLYHHTNFHRCCVIMAPSGFVALLCGWITTEVGRQPFTVYGLLRTADSVSPVDAAAVSVSLAAFVVVYFTVFGAGIFYLLRLMRKSPTKYEKPPEAIVPVASEGGSDKESLSSSNKLTM